MYYISVKWQNVTCGHRPVWEWFSLMFSWDTCIDWRHGFFSRIGGFCVAFSDNAIILCAVCVVCVAWVHAAVYGRPGEPRRRGAATAGEQRSTRPDDWGKLQLSGDRCLNYNRVNGSIQSGNRRFYVVSKTELVDLNLMTGIVIMYYFVASRFFTLSRFKCGLVCVHLHA